PVLPGVRRAAAVRGLPVGEDGRRALCRDARRARRTSRQFVGDAADSVPAAERGGLRDSGVDAEGRDCAGTGGVRGACGWSGALTPDQCRSRRRRSTRRRPGGSKYVPNRTSPAFFRWHVISKLTRIPGSWLSMISTSIDRIRGSYIKSV